MSFDLTRFTLNLGALGPQAMYQCSKAKKAYLQDNMQCVLCGAEANLEVHHIVPVHLAPELACDPNNFITLCDYGNKGCHYKFGHLCCFTKFNPKIQELVLMVRTFYSDNRLQVVTFRKVFEVKEIPDKYATMLEDYGVNT